ncbi:disease resistance protein At4g27190-like [Salvia miltiorrhiza]|uniref:disease resistance protein At4g27190-like n=1 Tax=Salvia miltiorrhiza TaxID=226208 RepID=UPI0025AC48C3|nr:disease resistance protein At4g27190-like [Salvia miltiorrhiza]
MVWQILQTLYQPVKDGVSYMKGKAKYVKKLEDNLTKIVAELANFYSRKRQIDQTLEESVSKERSDLYNVRITQFEVLEKRSFEYINNYRRLCHNDLPNFEAHDVSSATDVIKALQERKPTILTRKFFKLAKLSRKVSELLADISDVTDKMKQEDVLRDKKIESVQVKHDDIDLPSSTGYVERILRYLSEDGIRSIGILGAIGVGKTTILKTLNNQLKNSSMKMKFEYVIWIDCDKQRDAKDLIQDEIMGRLKLEKANSAEQNAEMISKFLWDKKYILLIDQVSSTINLDEVGIHKGHKHGRVVVASSNRKVIAPMIDEHVEIQPLSENEAFGLFKQIFGTIDDTRIEFFAECIVRSCGGLPLVIKLVAYHLKGQRNEDEWSDVKSLLQSETKAKLQNLQGVGHAYKLAYDKLDDSCKKCLLFVALFKSNYKIYKDYLVECWNAERFLEVDPLLRSARDRGATTLRELTDRYLVENHSDKHVKMPEFFRKVAAQQECVGENDGPRERMQLIGSKSNLPNDLKCNSISTLLMQHNRGLVSFEDECFREMNMLLILDLHNTKIESLPNSISYLVKLRCLYLNGCPLLEALPPGVKMLKELELLDIRGTSIRSLPDGMSEMAKLRCLRISFSKTECRRDVASTEVAMRIPLDMISSLHQLEELTIEAGCCSRGWNDIADHIVIELASLEKLSTLNFHFPKVSSLEKFAAESRSLLNTETHWGPNTLRSFNISVGCCEMKLPYGLEISRVSQERRLRFSKIKEISSVKEVLRQATSFELVGHSGVESLSEFDLKNAGTLKVCVVGHCTNMTSLVDGRKIDEMQTEILEETDCAVLQCLEKLHLFDLQKLDSIWRGPVSSGSLANLKDLTLFGCTELTTVLNHELVRALSSLEHIKVENCSKVVEIINEEIRNIPEHVDLSYILNKVKTVELVNLPMLRSICKDGSMNWKSLMTIVIASCNRLRDIHLSLRNAEKLETVGCEESWWNALHLPEEEKQRFLPHCKFLLEQTSASGVYHEGESSLHGRSTDLVASPSSSHGKEPVSHKPKNTNTPLNTEASSSLPVDNSISSH